MTRARAGLNMTECPGTTLRLEAAGVRVEVACGAIISINATRCRQCGTLFAPGSLTAFRLPSHAKTSGVKRDWLKRFLGG